MHGIPALQKRVLVMLLAIGLLLTTLPQAAFATITGAPVSITLTPEATVIEANYGSYMDLTGKVSDAYGNGVGGATVSFSVSTADGRVSPDLVQAGADGTYRTTFYYDSYNVQAVTIVATVAGTDVTASTTIQAVMMGGPYAVTLTPETNVVTGGSVNLSGKVTDYMGNPKSHVAVAFSFASGSYGYFEPAQTLTAVDGSFHTTFYSDGSSGFITIVATVVGTPVTGSATVESGNVVHPASITLTPEATVIEARYGSYMDLSGKVSDASGNGVGGMTVSFRVSSWSGRVSPNPVQTGSDGTFHATFYYDSYNVQAVNIVATVAGTSVTAKTTIQAVMMGMPAKVDLSPDFFVRQSGSVAITGRVTDAMGNPMAHRVVQFSATAGTVAEVKTDANGVFTAIYTAPDRVSLQGLTATVQQWWGTAPSASTKIHVLPVDLPNHPEHPLHP
ncbi:MAG: Ig-like domain-containing protein [Mycobacterium leprae]